MRHGFEVRLRPTADLNGDIFPLHEFPHSLAEVVHHGVDPVARRQDADAQRFVAAFVPRVAMAASRLLARRPSPGRQAPGLPLEVGSRLADEMPKEPHVGFRVLIHLSTLDGAEERRALVGPDCHPR
jgi:hypothetical protein